jgi:O-acetyl-ADP-ribose deacetylase (regulator of RNase III)
MFSFVKGNLFDKVDKVEGIINTVNCVGIMGKGIALEFKKRYPSNFKIYQESCNSKDLFPGKMLTVINENSISPRYIINFPTKLHWRNPSKIEYIEKGLDALKIEIQKHSIKSIAMPALGCGNGGLDWHQVKPLIINKLSDLENVEFIIYEPNVKSVSVNKEKNKTNIKITKTRALLMLLIEHFNSSSFKQYVTYEEVNHLAFIAQTLGAKLNLNFIETNLGPYDSQLNNLLRALSKNDYILIEKSHQNENYIKINEKKFSQRKSALKDPNTNKMYKEIKNLLQGFETKERIKALTIALWFYTDNCQYNKEQMIILMEQWVKAEGLIISEPLINEALNRVINLRESKMENMSFDI